MAVKDVKDFEHLEPIRPQAQNVVVAAHLSFDDFLQLFAEDLHGKIRGFALKDGVTHVVCFENLDMWSSELGQRSAVIVGSKQTHSIESILDTPYSRIGDVPSRFRYPVAYASVEALKSPALELVPEEEIKTSESPAN